MEPKKKQLYTTVPLWIRQKVLKWYQDLPAKDRKLLQTPPEPKNEPKKPNKRRTKRKV